MIIINCLFSPTSEIPHGFSDWCVLTKLVKNQATTHTDTITDCDMGPIYLTSCSQSCQSVKYFLF